MRLVAGLGLGFVGLVAGLVYWLSMASGDQTAGLEIPMAWGKPANGQIEMHAVVGVTLANKSRRREKVGMAKDMDWNKWVETHCLLKTASGEAVRVQRENHSSLIKPHELQPMVGTEEFFLTARLKPGTAYTFDYIIEQPDPTVFRYQFTAPSEAEKIRMHRFEPKK